MKNIFCKIARFMQLPVLTLMLAAGASAVEVETEGKAAGDSPAARSQALADALREAVREGAGVELVSESHGEL